MDNVGERVFGKYFMSKRSEKPTRIALLVLMKQKSMNGFLKYCSSWKTVLAMLCVVMIAVIAKLVLFNETAGQLPSTVIHETCAEIYWTQRFTKEEIALLDDGPQIFTGISGKSTIKQKVFNSSVFGWDMDAIDVMVKSREITWLNLNCETDVVDFIGISHLERLNGVLLRNLDSKRCSFVELGKHANLTFLLIWSPNLVDNTSWREVRIDKLRTLDLGSFGEDDLLPGEDQFPNLTALSIAHALVTDIGIRKISRSLPSLQYLDISFNKNITTDAVADLCNLYMLTCLNIAGTSLGEVILSGDSKSLDELNRRLPNCEVIFK